MPAQLLRDRLHFARRHALHVHLGERRHEGALRALIALEQLGREAALPVLRHPQLQFADPGDQRPTVGAGPVTEQRHSPLVLLGAERLRHLRFQDLLQRRSHDLADKLAILGKQCFQRRRSRLTLSFGHGVSSLSRGGDVEHHQHAMTARRFRRFAEPSAQYPRSTKVTA